MFTFAFVVLGFCFVSTIHPLESLENFYRYFFIDLAGILGRMNWQIQKAWFRQGVGSAGEDPEKNEFFA